MSSPVSGNASSTYHLIEPLSLHIEGEDNSKLLYTYEEVMDLAAVYCDNIKSGKEDLIFQFCDLEDRPDVTPEFRNEVLKSIGLILKDAGYASKRSYGKGIEFSWNYYNKHSDVEKCAYEFICALPGVKTVCNE